MWHLLLIFEKRKREQILYLVLPAMQSRLRKFIALFILTVFVFPLIAEQAHNLHHRNDTHCSERNTVHFHETEHHCFICDYIPVNSNKPTEQYYLSLTFSLTEDLSNGYVCIVTCRQQYNYPLRGPPFIS